LTLLVGAAWESVPLNAVANWDGFPEGLFALALAGRLCSTSRRIL
jgi:hypothetical protein